MVGRFIGSAVLQKVETGKLLALCAGVAALLVIMSMLTFGHVAIWSILLVGLFNSIMFPSIFTLGIAEMGPLTGEASGLLVTAIVGGAIIPELQGILADRIGIHHAFILPILCYLYIAYYGLKGSKVYFQSSCHPDAERSEAEGLCFLFNRSTKTGAPSFRAFCERVGEHAYLTNHDVILSEA